jgi:ABC-type glycerol-3-phosphate transport system substrate-binding protein
MKGANMKIKRRWLVLASLVAIATTTAALVAASISGASSGKVSGSITVWVDAVRLPVAKLYIKNHPNVKVKVVIYDGDGNGATTMQTKI